MSGPAVGIIKKIQDIYIVLNLFLLYLVDLKARKLLFE